MATKIFVNLPVKDLNNSITFFTKLGYKFDPQFTDENATCMIVSDVIFVMLIVETMFKTLTKKEVCDSGLGSEVFLSVSVDKREMVDEMIKKAVQAGGTSPHEPKDFGWMYHHGFQDPDGHLWEIIYMDMSKIDQALKS